MEIAALRARLATLEAMVSGAATGAIGQGGLLLDSDGRPVIGADGKPIVLTDPRVSVSSGYDYAEVRAHYAR